MRFSFTRRERTDLVKSWLAISLAFAIVMAGLALTGSWAARFAMALVISLVTAGLGFILHELAHKWLANRYECYAEYRADNTMLILALVTSLFGIVIAAPGAVHISGHVDHRQQGKIGLAGPATNLILAAAFLALFFLLSNGWVRTAAGFGSVINTWLGLFNLLPFGAFDGAKVIAWSKAAYGITVAVAVIMTFCCFFFIQAQIGIF